MDSEQISRMNNERYGMSMEKMSIGNMNLNAAPESVLNDVDRINAATKSVHEHINAELENVSKFLEAAKAELNRIEEHRSRLIEHIVLAEEKEQNLARAYSAIKGKDPVKQQTVSGTASDREVVGRSSIPNDLSPGY